MDGSMTQASTSHQSSWEPGMIALQVPVDLYEEVLHFISDRRRDQQASKAAGAPPPASPNPIHNGVPTRRAATEDWDTVSLLDFLDQANAKLKLVLVAVAEADDLTLSTAEIADAAGVPTGRGWGGFLSRAQASSRHRFGRDLPLQWKEWNLKTGSNVYFLEKHHAEVILTWSNQQLRHDDDDHG
jgi:hypothetical protein